MFFISKRLRMKAKDIRRKFLDFFKEKDHQIVSSAPMVTKDDPTLMFTNAGMNQFKDYFLGHRDPSSPRIADTQKCLRVSGKHNDLEEVGRDSYHHTMFEMLGNWSFGDYFKKEAIDWAWELLTEVYGLPKDRLYITIFGGDESESLETDAEAIEHWRTHLPDERILPFGKKDNFWEMGDTGPCGPCSEIHIDLRDESDRAKLDGATLVNCDDPQVIELWNLVFIQYNRKSDRSLQSLPAKHIDTGMGFERLCMVMQGKKSSYDSDVFTPLIQFIETTSGIKYTSDYSGDSMSDIAMRVISDHVRAVSFGIADGELPSNTGAGYVLRRILRRAIRYYFSFLNVKEPFIYQLVPLLDSFFGSAFPELNQQKEFIAKVILEEEKSFLRTLESGIKKFEALDTGSGLINGQDAFELYDTFGFPFDLTRLMAQEAGLEVDEAGFKTALLEQKERSRADAKTSMGDWTIVHSEPAECQFVGYDQLTVSDVKILKYRSIEQKGKVLYQIVLDKTPFYPEGGGQVGDTGRLSLNGETIRILNTVKENNLPILISDKLPGTVHGKFIAKVDGEKRKLTENNHSATHLLHAALRKVLGSHVQQKGSLVNDHHLRFDFSHFEKVSAEQIHEIESIVNDKIRSNVEKIEQRNIPIDLAREAGAMMLFGEKYGENVRMITFDPGYSVELCGGCHVSTTGQIGLFIITTETSVAAGVRRIEAITASTAEQYINEKLTAYQSVYELVKNPKDIVQAVGSLIDENKKLKKEIDKMLASQAGSLKDDLIREALSMGDMKYIAKRVDIEDSKALKSLSYEIEQTIGGSTFILFGFESNGKPQLMLTISKDLVDKGLHAGTMVRELAKEIQGGGGGQPFFATAGGKDATGLDKAIDRAASMLAELN